jgi:hypothetical protein
MDELRKISSLNKESWLRHDEQIDSRYYRKQSDRRDCLKRDVANNYIEEVQDYQKYVRESFVSVDSDIEGLEIVEEYPLFPSFTDLYVLVNSKFEVGESFENKMGDNLVVNRCSVGDKTHEFIKQSCNDNVILEIRDGKAYYSFVDYVYKFREVPK